MRRLPRIGRERRGFGDREQRVARVRAPDDVLPQGVLLRRREQDGQSGADFRVQRVFITAPDKGRVRQDVGRFPGAAALRGLRRIEFARQRLCEALVGRENGDAAGEPLGEMHK